MQTISNDGQIVKTLRRFEWAINAVKTGLIGFRHPNFIGVNPVMAQLRLKRLAFLKFEK